MAISKYEKYGVSPERALVNSEFMNLKDSAPSKLEKYNVDLTRLDIHVLTNELLIKRYNENNDTGIVRNYFKRLRINSQDKRLNALLDLVKTIREHSDNLIEFKAHVATQQQLFEIIADGKIEEAQLKMDEMRASYETRIERLRVERERATLELEHIKHQNEKARWDAEKAKYEAEGLRNKSRIIELRGNLINKIINELNFADINMKHVFVLIEMVKDSTNTEDIIGAEAKWEHLKEEARMAKAKADQQQTKADYDKYTFEQEKKDPVD